MNLAIKESKTNYVFINSPDIFIKKEVIQNLVQSISEIDTFALLAPTYFDETIHKNYQTKKYEKTNQLGKEILCR
jgi:GT2 family glycosyltransferase